MTMITLEQARHINGLFTSLVMEENRGRGWSIDREQQLKKAVFDYIEPLGVDIMLARRISNLISYSYSTGFKLPQTLNLNDYFGGSDNV